MELEPDLATNAGGMYLQMMGAPWIQPVPFSLRGPYATQTKALVSAKCGPRHPLSTIDIVSKGVCMEGESARGVAPATCA